MKKFFVSLIAICLSAAFLTGCTPASDIIPATTTEKTGILLPEIDGEASSFGDYAVCSESFSFYMGEYYYFFLTILKSTADELENSYGVDLGKSLKEQYVGNSTEKTWFDVIRDETLDYMKTLLFVYEKAIASNGNYKKIAEEYLNGVVIPRLRQESGGKPSEYINELYGGTVVYQNYLNAMYIEYIYSCYLENAVTGKIDSLTPEEVSAHADTLGGNKNETPVRKAICVRVPEGKNKANTFIEGFNAGGEKTADALKSLSNSANYEYFTDSFTQGEANKNEISQWLYDSGRSVGDIGAVEIKNDAYYAVFYIEDGEAEYLYEARLDLALTRATEEIKSGAASYSGFKADMEKLNSVNA